MNRLVNQKPYSEWINKNSINLDDIENIENNEKLFNYEGVELLEQQMAYGYSNEDVEILISPMSSTGSQPNGSMGNDAPLAVLSDKPQNLFSYFKQLFAQVSNPPLDPIREKMVTQVSRSNDIVSGDHICLSPVPLHKYNPPKSNFRFEGISEFEKA